MLGSLFQRNRRAGRPTPFEQECRRIFDIARKDGDNALAVILLPHPDSDGWDYHFTLSKFTAPALRHYMERAGHTVARVFSTRMELQAQWPDHPVHHPRELTAIAHRPAVSSVRQPA